MLAISILHTCTCVWWVKGSQINKLWLCSWCQGVSAEVPQWHNKTGLAPPSRNQEWSVVHWSQLGERLGPHNLRATRPCTLWTQPPIPSPTPVPTWRMGRTSECDHSTVRGDNQWRPLNQHTDRSGSYLWCDIWDRVDRVCPAGGHHSGPQVRPVEEKRKRQKWVGLCPTIMSLSYKYRTWGYILQL